MKLKTFRATDMADALAMVKKDLGDAAVILHTRTFKSGGLFGFGAKPMVEVIASDDATVAAMRRRRAAHAATERNERPRAPERKPVRAEEPKPASRLTSSGGVDAYRRVAAAAGGTFTPSGDADGALAVLEPPASKSSAARPSPAPPAAPIRPERPETPGLVMNVRNRRSPGPARPAAPDPADQKRGITGGVAAGLATPVSLAPVDAEARAALESELRSIKRMVGQVLQQAPSSCAPVMPEPLFERYLRLLDQQVSREIADSVVGAVRDELTPSELADPDVVQGAMLRRLAAMIPVADAVTCPKRAPDGRPLTIALIGPTGVGKTTTIAKLAASYKLRHGKKVGLVTSDTYRIAAVDQLRTYANIISVPLKVALSPEEMADACESLAACDAVLVDTAGRSQRDAGRIDELRAFIEAARPHETHLVLSSVASESVLSSAVERFAPCGPNRVILTKLDEAVHFGVLVNVISRIDARLSFVTTGQEVPDHIEPGRPDRLARLLLEGEDRA